MMKIEKTGKNKNEGLKGHLHAASTVQDLPPSICFTIGASDA
jgi:hypothetical protein